MCLLFDSGQGEAAGQDALSVLDKGLLLFYHFPTKETFTQADASSFEVCRDVL